MQTIDEVKKYCRAVGEGIAAAVAGVIALVAFSGMAGETADRWMSEFAGIDVSVVQTNRAVRFVLPNALGPFKDGTSFADGAGRIHQIRCVAEYPEDVKPEDIVKEVEGLIPLIERQFDCKCLRAGGDQATVRRWIFGLNESSAVKIQAYVAESTSQGKSNGCYMAALTFFRGKGEVPRECQDLR